MLGHVEMDLPTLDDVFNDDSGILDTSDDLSIFEYRHIPKEEDERKQIMWLAVKNVDG